MTDFVFTQKYVLKMNRVKGMDLKMEAVPVM